MIHIVKTKRWSYWQDKLSEQVYRLIFGLDCIHITPKERLAQLAHKKLGKYSISAIRRIKKHNLKGIVYEKIIFNKTI